MSEAQQEPCRFNWNGEDHTGCPRCGGSNVEPAGGAELPAMQRLLLRVLRGSVDPIVRQMEMIDAAVLARTQPPCSAEVLSAWVARMMTVYATTIDTPAPAPVRPKTFDDAPALDDAPAPAETGAAA